MWFLGWNGEHNPEFSLETYSRTAAWRIAEAQTAS
jgi:hypothetical protein